MNLDLTDELNQLLRLRVDAALKKKEQRAQVRQEFAARRNAGLIQRHQLKLTQGKTDVPE